MGGAQHGGPLLILQAAQAVFFYLGFFKGLLSAQPKQLLLGLVVLRM
jgi:hypothetical protein